MPAGRTGAKPTSARPTRIPENTLFEAAASEGQSIFVATGDEGAQGCNVNGEISATTGTDPVAQAVDPSTGTLYIADKSSNAVSVDSEGSTSDPSDFANASSVTTGAAPDAVVLDAAAGKVFVANSGSTSSLTAIATSTCNQTTTTGCGAPTQIASGGHLSAPDALAVNGSTLYVANTNGTVAVYNATTNAWVATVNLLPSSLPTALAVDATHSTLYVADASSHNRIEYLEHGELQRHHRHGVFGHPLDRRGGTGPRRACHRHRWRETSTSPTRGPAVAFPSSA